MSMVRVLVGTRKGAFILTSDAKRARWEVSGPSLAAGRSIISRVLPLTRIGCMHRSRAAGSGSRSSVPTMEGRRGRRWGRVIPGSSRPSITGSKGCDACQSGRQRASPSPGDETAGSLSPPLLQHYLDDSASCSLQLAHRVHRVRGTACQTAHAAEPSETARLLDSVPGAWGVCDAYVAPFWYAMRLHGCTTPRGATASTAPGLAFLRQ
jgi:hypothetical protein